MVSLPFALLLLLVSCEGPSALQWANQVQTQNEVQTCEGSNVTFPWLFSLDDGEQVEDIKWLYTPVGSSADLIAHFLFGHFIPVTTMQTRLRHVGNGSIELLHVTGQDSGEHSIEVSVHKGAQFSTLHHSTVLSVRAPPSQEELKASETDEAVYDPVTDQYHVQLACGHLTSLGHPPVSVVWTAPSGTELNSTKAEDGTFFLSVANPIKGGNYSCRLSPLSVATLCLPSDSPVLKAKSVQVDASSARLSLLEAKGDALKEENNKLKNELNDTRNTLINENNQLKQELNNTKFQLDVENKLLKDELKKTNGSLLDISNYLRIELRLAESLLNQLKAHVAGVVTDQSQTFNILAGRVNDLDSKVQVYQDKASKHVSFHAKVSSVLTLHTNDCVVFDDVLTNDGSAYNGTTGMFTVPVSGTYFFAFTTTPYSRDQFSNSQLKVDHHTVSRVKSKYVEYLNMATGHVVLRLTRGQMVWVASTTREENFDGELSFFTGFLVSPEW